MKEEKKPHTFSGRIGEKPFKVQIDLPRGHVVTGLSDKNDYWYGFTRPVPVKKGDVFSAAPGKGLILNGKLVPRNFHPKRKMDVQMGWAPRRLRVAVFQERDRVYSRRLKRFTKRFEKPYWCATDVRGYWIGTGDTVEVAIKRLIDQVQFTELMQKEEEKKGRRVIRWHVERSADVRKDLRQMEAKARKNGFILEGVDWRECVVAKKMVEA